MRLKQSGGKVWMDPSIETIYFARSNLRDLSRQYWRYGYWKAQMIRKYPKTLRWRQFVPPLFVLTLIGLGILSLWFSLARWLLVIIVILYTIIMFIQGLMMSRRHKSVSLAVGVPLAIATIHISWGSAFLWSLLAKPKVIESPK